MWTCSKSNTTQKSPSLADTKYGQFVIKCTPYKAARRIVSHTRLAAPRSIEEIQRFVCEASNEGKTISILGSGRSQGGHVLGPPSKKLDKHLVLDLRAHINTVTIVKEQQQAIAQAGATWWEVQLAADQYGLAVQVMQASNIFSVGGSLSVNCHGHDHRVGSLANTVNWITIVDSLGKLQKLEPSDEHFGLVVGGYGQFGIIVEVALQLTGNHLLTFEEEDIDVTTGDYPQLFQGLLCHENEHKEEAVMHYVTLGMTEESGSFFRNGTKTRIYRLMSGCPVVEGSLSIGDEEPDLGTVANRIGKKAAVILPSYREEMKALVYHGASGPKARNEWMQNPIKFMDSFDVVDYDYWLQEYFVPGESFKEFCSFLGKLLCDNKVDLWNATVRYVKQDRDNILMTYAKSDVFAIVIYFRQELSTTSLLKTQAWVQKASEEAVNQGGSFYLPYQPLLERELLERAYPNIAKVRELKHKYDPANIFSSTFAVTYLFPPDIAPRFVRQITVGEVRSASACCCTCIVQ